MKNLYNIIYSQKSYLTVLLFIVIVWFLIFITSGSLSSGFHFTDDHTIVEINYNLTNQNLNIIEVFTQWIKTDLLTGRFRPFYFIHRITITKVLGINFWLWSIYTGILAIFTTFFFFIFAKLLNFSIKNALLFSFLITLGEQSAVWWQLGPAETIGTFLLSASVVLAVLSEKNNQHKILYEASLIIVVLIMSLSKESFILVIPAIVFIKIWMSCKLKGLPWSQAIKKNAISISIFGLIFSGELLFVKFFLGLTPDIGYAGVDRLSLPKIINATKDLNEAGSLWIILVCFFAMALMTRSPNFPSIIDILNYLYFPIILLFLVAAPQILLYAKTGISQRYILPGIFGYALLLISLCRYLNQHSKLIAKLVLLFIMVTLGLKLNLAWEAAHTFALEGKSTNALLQTLESKVTEQDPILIVTNPLIYYEWNFSIKKYLNYVPNIDNIYLETYGNRNNYYSTPLNRTINNILNEIEKFYDYKTLDKIENKNTIQCIVTFPGMKNIFLRNSSSWFIRDKFEEYEFGHFNRNLNKNSKIYLYCKKLTD